MKLVKIQNEVKIISKLKTEDIKRLKAINKNVQYDDKGKPILGVDIGTNGSINSTSITFNETTEDGYAMLTMVCASENETPANGDLLKDFTERYVNIIDKLTAFEPAAWTVLDSLDTRINEIVENAETIHING